MKLEPYCHCPHVLVTPAGRPGSFVDRALREHGLSRRVAVKVHSFLLAPEYIVDTDYLLTVPRKVAQRAAASHDVVLSELPISVPGISLAMVWHARNHRDHAHQWLREQILQISKAL